MDSLSLTIGDTLMVEGFEFVVYSTQVTHDGCGRSVNIHCQDPLLAQQTLDRARQTRIMLTNQETIAPQIPKLGKLLDAE